VRSCILTYHSIDDSGSVISIRPESFAAHIRLLAAGRRPVVPLSRVRHVPGSLAITFDDGLESFYHVALPLLLEHRMPATVFVVSGYAGKSSDWPSQPPEVPRMPLMSWEQIRECSRAGVQIGCHTVSHPRLPDLKAEDIERELNQSRTDIEQQIGRPVEVFSYPYGAVDNVSRACASRHFRLACGTQLAYLGACDDPLCLPRLDCYYLRNPQWFAQLNGTAGELYISARAVLRRAATAIRTRVA
jgi:peptidoglycan/xylan/chitin deacetylase (PgdA/CDA1 family)